jgi:tetratricopeptide (TPR) repeat protein
MNAAQTASPSITWQQVPAPADLPAELAQDLLFPRRPGSASHPPDLQSFTDDLNLWLLEHPQQQPRYSAAAAWLNYRSALTLATSGYPQLALHYFESALSHSPELRGCRLNYAIALHSLKQESSALQQYEQILPSLDPLTDSHIYHLAARLHARNGNPRRALELLDQAAAALPEDPSFWALRSSLRPSPQAPTTNTIHPDTPSGPKFCRHCGSPLKPSARFCPQCGQAITRP